MEHASLMYGTLLSQLAVGTFVAGYALTRSGEERARLRPAILAAFAAGVVGVLVFFTHLGVPTHAFNAIRNVGSSWLSREALLYPAFMLLLILCLLKGGKVLGALTALCGLALALTTAMIYTLPGVPAWDTAATPISFLLAAFLMGIPLAALLTKRGGRTCALVLAAAALLALVVTLTQTSTLRGGETAAAASASLLTAAPAFRIRLGLLAVAAIASLVFALRGAKAADAATDGKPAATPVFLLLFCLLAVSEILGRALFFGTIVRM